METNHYLAVKKAMNLSNMKTRSLLIISILIGFGVASLFPVGVYAAGEISSGKKKLMVSELMRVSGLGQTHAIAHREVPPEVFKDASFLGTLDMQSEEMVLINNLYQKGFDEGVFYRDKFSYILEHFDGEHIKAALAWFRSPQGRMVVKAEEEFTAAGGDFQSLVTEISGNLPSKARLLLADRIENARHKTQFDMEVRVAMLRVIDPLNERFQAAPTEEMVKKVKKDLEDLIRTNNLLYTLHVYNKIINLDLAKMASFYESPAGRWFNRVHLNGSLKGFNSINEKIGIRLANILLAIDSGKEDHEMAKEVFPPGFRFLIAKRRPPAPVGEDTGDSVILAKTRDPFVPLVIIPDDELENDGDQVITTFADGGADVLPEIPFELYRKLKDIDPMLYQDLEFYAKLFSDKKDLDALTRDDYANEVDNYKSLIEKANGLILDMIITPLQTDYKKLVLSGFVWAGEDNLAIITTPDQKGHSVKEGTIIGPKFGIVESVDQEKVVVIERVRDYLGNIITKTVDIEFPETAEE